MNPRTPLIATLALVAGLLAGCATPTAMVLTDGREIHAVDKPDFDEETGFYEIEQLDGTKVRINKDEVESIREL